MDSLADTFLILFLCATTALTRNLKDICAEDGSDGRILPHMNCNQFYKCAGGKPVALTCKSNLRYNMEEQFCDWPENVNCGARLIPQENVIESPLAICALKSSQGKLIPNDLCNEYFICSCGSPLALKCPLNLLYNPAKKSCDLAMNVECGNRIIPKEPELNPAEICAIMGSDRLLLAHENCNQFYICSFGAPSARTCRHNLLFNPKEHICDWPENVDCGDRIIPEITSSETSTYIPTTTAKPEINNITENPWEVCATDSSNSILLSHENCKQFYICANGAPVRQTCPATLLYNPLKFACDWPENVECGNRTIPEVTTTARPETENFTSTTSRPVERPSSNPRPSNSTTPTQEGDNITGNPWEVCATDGSNNMLLTHENCNQFYTCANGAPVLQACTARLLYNPLKLACDWPENVKCGNRTIPEVTTTARRVDENFTSNTSRPVEHPSSNARPSNSTTPAPEGDNITGNPWEVCATDGTNIVILSHRNCDQFYFCVNGAPVTETCPGNLLYNPLELACDWPENVDCGDRIIPVITTTALPESQICTSTSPVEVPSTTAAPTAEYICALEGSHGMLLPNSVCYKYYICMFGRPVAQVCPSHLLFNSRQMICDWPDNVDCGDRPTYEIKRT